MELKKYQLRLMGLSGILGGLILFAGDMLFYFDSYSIDLKKNMGNVSDLRIMLSGLFALFATWLYIIGIGQIYYAFKPSKTNIRNIVVACFAGIMIAYGIVHGAYVAIAISAKLAVQNNLDIETATFLASKTNQLIRIFIYPLFILLSFFFIRQVWVKKTLYPRWIIWFFPLIPFPLQWILKSTLSGWLWIITVGGFFNILLIVFFTASTVALWNKKN